MTVDGARKICWATFLLAVAGISFYAIFSVSRVMTLLAVKPDGDLYANDLSFQILVFVLLKGIPLLLGTLLIVFLQWKYLKNFQVNEQEKSAKELV